MQSSLNTTATQRRLILIRHAKAVEDHPEGDHARGLSERGHADAAALGIWLKSQALVPEQALCSTATRTRETLAGLLQSIPNTPTILSDKIYLASTAELLMQIQATDDAVHSLMLVCHNPGAHGLLAALVDACANEADGEKMLLKFPTSACAVMDFKASSWREVVAHTALLAMLRY